MESAFVVSRVDLVSLNVNNVSFPSYGIDNFEQTYYGVRFSVAALFPPFKLDSNNMEFTVKLSYTSPGKRSVDNSNKPDSLVFTKVVGIRTLSTPGTGGSNSTSTGKVDMVETIDYKNNSSKSGVSMMIIIGSAVGVVVFVAFIVIILVVVKKRKVRKNLKRSSIQGLISNQ